MAGDQAVGDVQPGAAGDAAAGGGGAGGGGAAGGGAAGGDVGAAAGGDDGTAGGGDETAPGAANPNTPFSDVVQRTRAWTGLWVVVAGDVVIAVAAIWGVYKTSSTAGASSSLVAILTSAFTAIGTMTTAYFGIRSSTNTAQSALQQNAGASPNATTPAAGGQGRGS